MPRQVTTADFIRRARNVHGDRYNYSKVLYENAKKNVAIICPEHGEFEQRPTNHLTGHGCHACGGNKPLTLDRFVDRANRVHSKRYDYSRVKLKNVESKVEIICPDHDSFFQRPMSHLRGFGCSKCGRILTAEKLGHSRERFIEDARRAHGDRYNYSQVAYLNAQTKVNIVCPNHGVFAQTPASHIRDIGCPSCGAESTAAKKTRTTEEFVQEAREVHEDRYDYSRVKYISSHEKVEIVCKEHGSFWTSAVNHVRGNQSGCPGCATSGFDQTKAGLLYYIAVFTDAGDTLYKIGITNLTITKRFPTADLARIRVVRTWRFAVGRDAAERESEILNQYAKDRYFGPNVLEGAGNTELFTHDVLGLDGQTAERDEPAVDRNANLISRQVQRDFGFC